MMKRSNTQFERQTDIGRRIRAGGFPSVPFLAAEWEVDERTIKRDIEFMRDRLLAPIEYDRTRRGYFYTEPTWGMPAVSMREGEWYLFGRGHYKGDVIQLAIHRLENARETGAEFQSLDPFDPAELKRILFGRYASMQGKNEIVRIRVAPEGVARIRQTQWHAQQEIIEFEDGAVEIAFPVASGGSKFPYANVIAWVLGLGSHARVLAPQQLKQLVADEVRRMGQLYP